jgi:Cu2+-containing amine oxidase
MGSTYPATLVAQAPLDPLSVGETDLAKSLFLKDPAVQAKLGGSKDRFRIVAVERHEQPKNVALTAERAADVVAYDYTTDAAISAVVPLSGNAVLSVVAATGVQPSASPEELAEARDLAISAPSVQSRLASVGVATAADPALTVTHIFVKDTAGDGACAVHRCLLLFFNTKDASLDVAPIVDLSARTVRIP